ncbi:MAG: MerC domain-containing protein [Planctomycetia bacterium]|nr:MerC domain-containing protein [Planctomycetia bacterium]
MKTDKPAIRWRDCLTTLLAVGLALLPRLACPCQLPAYAGLLGSMGLAFLTETVYLFPLTAMCLTLAVGGLAVQAKRRWGYGPFLLGVAAAAGLMFGKFLIAAQPLVHGGIALLLVASLWNALPRKERAKFHFNPDGSLAAGPPRHRQTLRDGVKHRPE